jgi:putative transposase
VFADEADRTLWVDLLTRHAAEQGVAVHAWTLMPDHIHLLLTPLRDGALSLCMQAVGRGYVQAFNRRHDRTGTLWEGRYRSTVLQPEPWLLRAMVWMDTHPVRSRLADQAGAHPWTTAAHYLGLRTERGLTVQPQYWALGNTPFAREAAYRTLLERGSAPVHTQALAAAALKGWALGTDEFVHVLQGQTPRRLQAGKAGRPRTEPLDLKKTNKNTV